MFGALLVAIIVVGFIVGKLVHKYVNKKHHYKLPGVISALQNLSVLFLLFLMGYKIGSDKEIIANFSTLGVHAVLFGLAALLGSAAFTLLFITIANKIHLKKKKDKLKSHVPFSVNESESSQWQNILMIALYLGLVIIGGILGYFQCFFIESEVLENLVDASLMALVFFIGADMGLSQLNLEHLKSIGKSAVLICLGVIFGSVTGAVFAGLLLKYDLLYSVAVGAPMGWYSLAGILLSKIDAELGAMAFSANLIRELTAIAAVPLIGTVMSPESAIASCGATAMDTTLPSIIKGLGRHYAVTGFACGIIISFIVPFLLFIIQIVYGII